MFAQSRDEVHVAVAEHGFAARLGGLDRSGAGDA